VSSKKEVVKMMYNTGIVCVVKCNGKILREDKDFVTLPFSSEYSILLKNLETRKAKVNVSIDGQDVLDGNSLILNPNTETELEGFMKGIQGKNKFRFIQKTKEISDFRGDRLDDGIIRVEYWFEKFVEKIQVITEHNHYDKYYPHPYYPWYRPYPYYPWTITYTFPLGSPTFTTGNGNGESLGSSSTFTSSCSGGGNLGSARGSSNGEAKGFSQSNEVNHCYNVNSLNFTESQVPLKDEGITIKGSEINQQFNYAYIGQLEDQSRVLILRLRGVSNSGAFVQEPITVNKKITCGICGKKSRSHLKHCSNCGNFLG
jgi:hypothetical protein